MERKGLTFLGESSGHKFYTFAAFDNMCMARKDMFLLRMDEYERFGIQKENMFAFCDLIAELVNDGNLMEVAQLTGHLKYLMTLPVNTHMITYIAAPLVLIGNEDETGIEHEEMELKTKIALKDQKVQGFFLRATKLLSISGLHMQDFRSLLESLRSQQNQQIEKIFYEKLGQKTTTQAS